MSAECTRDREIQEEKSRSIKNQRAVTKERIIPNAEVDSETGASNDDEKAQTPGSIQHEMRQETAIRLGLLSHLLTSAVT